MSKLVPYKQVQDFVKTYFSTSITKTAYIAFIDYFTPVAACVISQGLRAIQNKELKDFASKHKDTTIASHIYKHDVEKYINDNFLKKTSTLNIQQICAILEFIMAEVLETLDKKITEDTIKQKFLKHSELACITRKTSKRKSTKKVSAKKSSSKKRSSSVSKHKVSSSKKLVRSKKS